MTRHLANLGHSVTAFWRRPEPSIAAHENVSSVIGDLRDVWTLADALADTDIVFHFASATYPSRFFSNPTAEYWEALQPLMVLMETAARAGVKKMVYPSSGGTIYADSQEPRTEDSALDPRSPYAVFKVTAEHLLKHAARTGQFSVDIFRVGNPYGPGQRIRPGQGVLPHWLDAARKRQTLNVFGDGSAQRDYIYIDDLCKLMETSCDQLENSETLNLGTGIPTSLLELLECLQNVLPEKADVEFLPGRDSDISSIVLSPKRVLARIPGFEFTALQEGIRRTYDSLQQS